MLYREPLVFGKIIVNSHAKKTLSQKNDSIHFFQSKYEFQVLLINYIVLKYFAYKLSFT